MTPGPLRIAYVLSHFHPHASGAERQALAQGRELVRRGHRVRVITRAIPGHDDDETIEGVVVHRWVRTSAAGPLFGLSFVAGVARALRRLRGEIDLIHTHQGLWEAISTGLARPLIRPRPTLIQPASSGYYGEAEELMRTKGAAVLQRLILRNTAFAAISGDIERQWLDLGVPPGRMIRMASGVDDRHFRPGPSSLPTLPIGRPRVVFTGRLHPQKDLDLLVDIWPEVARQTRAHLVLIGAGPDRDRLATRAADLGVADSVHFAGSLPDPAEAIRGADLFVLPSVAEGMSNSLLEAMATGLPCLASDIGGNRDLITPGSTGWLAPPKDRPAWTRAIVEILRDPGLATEVGGRARALVEQQYSLTRIVDRYVALYRRMMAGGPIDDQAGRTTDVEGDVTASRPDPV